ncbi:MAG: hypothetical protein NKF70_00665 [Methanobacterium sp. ERen5]|nr:MAG: hypothetical protein NKF70_00665 [Methanobacterium sp. ERen5]
MNLDDKGQFSAEFILISLIVLIILGGLISLVGSTMDKTQTADNGGARIMGEKIAETINTAYVGGNGYSIDLDLRTMNQELSSTGSPFSFSANITKTGDVYVVAVTNAGVSSSVSVIPKKFNGTTTNLNNKNVYHVKNVNGTIQIT